MKKNRLLGVMFILLTILLVACGKDNTNKDKLNVVSTFTIITDMVEEIGKDKVDVHNLVPTGTDPHEYEPLANDLRKASNADILFYNGFNLEGGKKGWFFKMLKTINKDEKLAYNLSEGTKELYLNEVNPTPETINPHNFISPKNGLIMAKNILKGLIEVDAENKDYYEKNYNVFKTKLEEIEKKYEEEFSKISNEERIIVTSERAFQYLAKDYNIKEGYIWAIDTDENGTKEQITKLIEFIKENKIKYLFLESNVDPRPMKTISEETNIPIYKDYIFSDEIGKKGEINDTYIKYLEHNLKVFINGIKGE